MADLGSMSVVAVGRKYGVSDQAVRKWIRWYEYRRAHAEYEGGCSRTNDVPDADERAA